MAAQATSAAAPETDAAGLGKARATAFVTPALLLVGAFLVFPALWTLYLGITDYRLTGIAAADPQIVGLQNYTDALTDPQFRNALALTLLFVLGSAIVGQTVLGFSIAWSMRAVPKTVKTVVESLVLLAWILPSSIVAFLWIAYLNRDNGTLNSVLGTSGFDWLLGHPMLSIIVFNTWRGTAFSMLLFSAALNAVPPSQLETARLAGADTFAQFRDVVFPHIRGHVLTNTLLISLWTFNDFSPYLLTAGGPNHASETLPVYIYNSALYSGELGYGSAISLIMLLINLLIAVFYLRLLKDRRS
ncbi:MAG: multiple sugar transport system permease protein [Actinomycetota bacterium]|nr:multiple sugar transport system permease protein [Actinomycetota bacterium]MDQ1665352.1 multiple sugar transport system permease protein [Actinomycetota bacterium]